MSLIDRIRSLWSPKPDTEDEFIATQPNGVPFPWHAGVTMRPLSDVIIALPAAVLDGDTPIGQVIEGRADVELALRGTPGNDSNRILLRIKKGRDVTLRRSVEAVVVSADPAPAQIHVSGIASVRERLTRK